MKLCEVAREIKMNLIYSRSYWDFKNLGMDEDKNFNRQGFKEGIWKIYTNPKREAIKKLSTNLYTEYY